MPHDTIFNEHRPLLNAVAYRVLGRWSDAKTWSRTRGCDGVLSTSGRLKTRRLIWSRVTTRLAIDRLRSAASRRETYVGPWLPEPILTAQDVADDVARSESVSLAMLLVLESLSRWSGRSSC